MKRLFFGLIICLPMVSQAENLDSLRMILRTSVADSVKYRASRVLYYYYEELNKDSGLLYSEQCLAIAIKNRQKLAEVNCLDNKAYQLIGLGRYAASLQCLLDAFKILEDKSLNNEVSWRLFTGLNFSPFNGNNRLLMLSYTHHIFGILMWRTNDLRQSIFHFAEARRISTSIGHANRHMMASMNLGRSYFDAGRLDSVLLLEKEAADLAIAANQKKYLGQIYTIMANVYYQQKDTVRAEALYKTSMQVAQEQQNFNSLNASCYMLARLYLEKRQKDSALLYSLMNEEIIKGLGFANGLTVNQGMIYDNIYKAYKLYNNSDSVFKYMQLALVVKDSLHEMRVRTLAEFQNATLNEQLRLQHAENDRLAYRNMVRVYGALGGLLILLLIAAILFRNNLQKQKANLVLASTLQDLKQTQTQLVHAEKMASLGELTAGIAHEIQNPLNFVNNFSDINKELAGELEEELNAGNYDDAKAIASDIKTNEEKISHHGKRAQTIVTGMLQHSRSGKGEKQLTDVNKLADEYLRLSYHGIRAKDKDFNCDIETSFDESIGQVNIIPQEIGRVILNLVNNAFYAVHEKSKLPNEGYKPTVTVITKKENNTISISVADNGNGIPEKIKEKIFNPFFTTKPTGQGTGLGLSLSYDIVKAHGGELNVESNEGEGSEFIIQVPFN